MKFFSFKSLFLLFSAFIGAESQGGGAVCFTFDDYAGANWIKADALFKKYNAHATFFISGAITPERIGALKKLQDAGHSIGLHTLNHRNAVPMAEGWDIKKYFEKEILPQLEVCRKNGLEINGFAYPNNRRNGTTDEELFKYFSYLRAGQGKARKPIFYGARDIKKNMVLGGGGIGAYYKSDVNALKKLLKKASDNGKMIVFFSHDIYPGAQHIHMPSELLEELLKYAAELKMKVVSIDEIPRLELK